MCLDVLLKSCAGRKLEEEIVLTVLQKIFLGEQGMKKLTDKINRKTLNGGLGYSCGFVSDGLAGTSMKSSNGMLRALAILAQIGREILNPFSTVFMLERETSEALASFNTDQFNPLLFCLIFSENAVMLSGRTSSSISFHPCLSGGIKLFSILEIMGACTLESFASFNNDQPSSFLRCFIILANLNVPLIFFILIIVYNNKEKINIIAFYVYNKIIINNLILTELNKLIPYFMKII